MNISTRKYFVFNIPQIDRSSLISRGIALHEKLLHRKLDRMTMSDEYINHIILNFIRHLVIDDYTNCQRVDGTNDAEYLEWFETLNNAIRIKYPELDAAASQQIVEKRNRLSGYRGRSTNSVRVWRRELPR